MAVEIVNWLEIPVHNMARARNFYEQVFEFKLVDVEIAGEVYPCFPSKEREGFSGALVQYDFTRAGKEGPLVYLNSYRNMDGMLVRITASGGKVTLPKKEIAPGFGFFAVFEDTEGNQLALQGME